jgi:hypothetical protein
MKINSAAVKTFRHMAKLKHDRFLTYLDNVHPRKSNLKLMSLSWGVFSFLVDTIFFMALYLTKVKNTFLAVTNLVLSLQDHANQVLWRLSIYCFIRFILLDVAESGCTGPWRTLYILLLKTDLKKPRWPTLRYNTLISHRSPAITIYGWEEAVWKCTANLRAIHLLTSYCFFWVMCRCTPNVEAVCAPKMFGTLYQTTRCYNPEDRQMNLHCLEHFKHSLAEPQQFSKNLGVTSKF